MVPKLILAILAAGLLVCSPGAGLAQIGVQQRIAQPIIVNGQRAEGVTVLQNGAVQSFTCPSPQPYVAADRSSSGWACLDEGTGAWLTHAQPPASTEIYEYPYVSPYDYDYPYDYYDRYLGAPAFSFGFGFGGGDHHERHEHEHGHGKRSFEHGHGGEAHRNGGRK
jgi:hypothetical protein